MKKIFLVSHDPSFASITVEPTGGSTDLSNLQADVIEEEDYKQPICRVSDTSLPLANFIYLNDTALVFDDKTDQLMADFIGYASMGIEFPLDVQEVGKFWLLNVVETCNPLDKKASQWIPGSWQETIALEQLVFHPKRVSSVSSLFKIPELDYKPILCVSGHSEDEFDQEHDFYSFYHEHGLTGLKFTEIWRESK